jgi:hypothetical protein
MFRTKDGGCGMLRSTSSACRRASSSEREKAMSVEGILSLVNLSSDDDEEK